MVIAFRNLISRNQVVSLWGGTRFCAPLWLDYSKTMIHPEGFILWLQRHFSGGKVSVALRRYDCSDVSSLSSLKLIDGSVGFDLRSQAGASFVDKRFGCELLCDRIGLCWLDCYFVCYRCCRDAGRVASRMGGAVAWKTIEFVEACSRFLGKLSLLRRDPRKDCLVWEKLMINFDWTDWQVWQRKCQLLWVQWFSLLTPCRLEVLRNWFADEDRLQRNSISQKWCLVGLNLCARYTVAILACLRCDLKMKTFSLLE
jgi:hypothetical protein